jgi:hypothetical protein
MMHVVFTRYTGSNQGRNAGYPDRFLRGFTQSLPELRYGYIFASSLFTAWISIRRCVDRSTGGIIQ